MRTIVKGKNIDVPDAVRQYAERKMRRLERFLDDRSEAVVELSSEQHRSNADSQIVAVTLVVDGQTLRGRAAGPTFQAGLDAVIDRIERQAIDFRKKPRDKARPQGEKAKRLVEEAATSLETPSMAQGRRLSVPTSRAARAARKARSALRAALRGGGDIELPAEPAPARRSAVVKTKRFAIEPMFEEDAVARMEELGHLFFIFVNAETERLCVLYRRQAGDFGLIEPVIGGEYTTGRGGDPAALGVQGRGRGGSGRSAGGSGGGGNGSGRSRGRG